MIVTTGILASAFNIPTGNAIVGVNASVTHAFAPSFVYGRGQLTTILLNGSDNLGAGFTITKVVDENGPRNVQDVCVLDLKNKFTSITYLIGVGISAASIICTTDLYDIVS
jgi:hypothetical protein